MNILPFSISIIQDNIHIPSYFFLSKRNSNKINIIKTSLKFYNAYTVSIFRRIFINFELKLIHYNEDDSNVTPFNNITFAFEIFDDIFNI